MPEDLLKGFDPSSPGLVPVLRAVRGPSGIFTRKYYVDLKRIRKMVQEIELNSVPYLFRIPGYNFLKQFLETKNVKPLLQNLFPKGSNSTRVIYNRYVKADKIECYKHKRQRFFQNLYAYYLTKDKWVEKTFKSYLQPSIKFRLDSYKTQIDVPSDNGALKIIKEKRTEPSPFLFHATRKRPQRTPWVFVQNDERGRLLPKSVPPKTQSKDYGKLVRFNLTSIQKEDHPGFAGELSRFFNYLQPNVRKTILMLSKTLLFGGLMDKDWLITNLTLLPDMIYPAKSDYWSIILSRALLNTGSDYKQTELCDQEKRLYQYMLLKTIDSETFDLLCSVCPPPIPVDNSLDNWLDLTVNQRMYLLASRVTYNAKERYILENTYGLDEFIRYLSALAPVMESSDVFDILQRKFNNCFDLSVLFSHLKQVQIDDISPNFLYFSLQLFGSQLLKLHYFPYDRIGDTRHGPFSPYLSLKIRKSFTQIIRGALLNSVSNLHSSVSQRKIEVVLPIPTIRPIDSQLFVRIEPFMVVFPKDLAPTYIRNGIDLTISGSHIVHQSDSQGFLVVSDLLKAIV